MSAGYPLLAFDVAVTRQDDLLQEAEAKRIVAIAGAVRPRFAAGLQTRVGHTLVDLGERLQNTRQRPFAGDLATTGTLRISR